MSKKIDLTNMTPKERNDALDSFKKITQLSIELSRDKTKPKAPLTCEGFEISQEFVALMLEQMIDSNATYINVTHEGVPSLMGNNLSLSIRTNDHFKGWRKHAHKLVVWLGLA